LPHQTTNTKWGFAGGVTGGWNSQAGCTVFGVEADYSWAKITADSFHSDPGFPVVFGPNTLSVSSTLKEFGTVRARTGFVVNNLLLYVTGGVAGARFDRNLVATKGFLVDYAGIAGLVATVAIDYETTCLGLE